MWAKWPPLLLLLLLGHIAALATHRVACSVGRSVGLSIKTVSPARMAEPIVMMFGMLTWVGPRNHVLDGCPDPRTLRGNFGGEKGPAQDMPDGRYG